MEITTLVAKRKPSRPKTRRTKPDRHTGTRPPRVHMPVIRPLSLMGRLKAAMIEAINTPGPQGRAALDEALFLEYRIRDGIQVRPRP